MTEEVGPEERREAARVLGKSKTPAQQEARRANAAKAAEGKAAKRRKLSEIECTCGAGDSLEGHARKCPRYLAIYYRRRKGLPLE